MVRTYCVRLLNSSCKWRGKWAIGPNPKLKRLCPGSGNLIGSTAWNSAVFLVLFEKWNLLSCVWLFATPWTIQSMELSRPEYWSGYPFPSPGDLPNPEIEPRYPALQSDSLPAEPQGKPKNTGVGSLSLLQRIFLTQGSNQGLLHRRRILYQLSYEGSSCFSLAVLNFALECHEHCIAILQWLL